MEAAAGGPGGDEPIRYRAAPGMPRYGPGIKPKVLKYEDLPSEPIAVHELLVQSEVWEQWKRSANRAGSASKVVSLVSATIGAIILAVPGLAFLPGGSKSVVVCYVPLGSWCFWRIVRDVVLRRRFMATARDMRAVLVPALFHRVSDVELLNLARRGGWPVVDESKVARVKQRDDGFLIVVDEYDLELYEAYLPMSWGYF